MLAAGDVTVLEFTLTGRGAIEAVSATRKALGDTVCVGVGTVLNSEDAESAIDAGAQFAVTPAIRREVIATCTKRQTLILCGGFSPTELLKAYEAGAELVKVFPAQLGVPKFIKDVLARMPFHKLVPTGDVSPENARVSFSGCGDKGNIAVRTPFTPRLNEEIIMTNSDEKRIITTPGEDLYLGEVENMADAILDGKAIRMSLADSRNNVATIQALLLSTLEGKPITM